MENNYRIYTGEKTKPEQNVRFPELNLAKNNPENYSPDHGLVEAVNLAILMNQPLLLTGEPGTGKTQLAYHVAWELGLGEPLKFETRSTSLSRDLFYYFDSMGLFQSQYNKEASRRPADYINYNALGLAILRSKDPESIKNIVPEGFQHTKAEKSLVLIDEIDKAPRDFPNDLLNQIEDLYFRIPELKNELVKADRTNAPITIITSNSEKNLPNAFLRRCIFYHITFPGLERLEKIAARRLRDFEGTSHDSRPSTRFIADGVNLLMRLRDEKNQIKKKPGTAELMVWLNVLRATSVDENPFQNGNRVLETMGAVIKEHEDGLIAKSIIEAWLRDKAYKFAENGAK